MPLRASRGLLRWYSRASSRDENQVLRDVQHSLAEFSGAAEKVFVPVGERLFDLQLRSREIARRTNGVAELLSQDDHSLGILGDVLNAAEGVRQHDEILAAMQAIQENAAAVHQAIGVVMRLVNTFDVLGVMTRIESSRFEAEGASFGGLAEAVSTLSQQIRGKMAVTAESAAVLLGTSRQATVDVRRVAQTREDNLGPLTRQTSAGLSKVRDHRNRVSRANTLLAARFDGISTAIGDIVTGLQFHDIVRQQVEHILEALGTLDRSGRTAGFGETVRLQTAQLDNSCATFQRSVGHIRDALAQIEANIGEVADESGRMLISPDGSEASFFTSLEADLAAIAAILERNIKADRDLAEVGVSVHQRVSEMADAIAGVHAIGIEMQRIALNATIQAAHLGPAGAALEIVALAIQGLARDSEAASDRIENLLRDTRKAVTALEKATGGSDGGDELLALLRQSAGALKCLQQQVHDGHLGAVDLVETTKRQVGEAIALFGGADECLDALTRAGEKLQGVSNGAPPTGLQAVGSVASTYTMQSERAVHEALYDTAARNEDFTPVAVPAETEGDNVEFF